MSWNEIQLGDFFQIKHGFAFKSQYFGDAGKHIVLTPGNFYEAGGFRVRPEKERYYIAEPPEDFILKPGDLIVAMTEQGEGLLGSSAIIPSEGSFLHNQRIGLIENLDEKVLNKGFLYRLFNCRAVRGQIRASASGTKVRHTAPKRIYAIRVKIPSLPEQAKISEIASAYDDLIENNRRRIGLLEEAARLLYREWFVYFRFPGHEHVKITNGLPDGWERRSLGELAIDLSYGFTESASHDVEGPKFLRITDIVDGPIDWSSVPRCPISDAKLQRFLLFSGDIVVARTGATTGWARRIGRMSEPSVFASYLVRFRFDDTYRPELAATFMESAAYKAFVRANLGGAAQPNASAVVLGSVPIPIPTPALQKDFAEAVAPMHEQIDALMEQNQKLAGARDLLLPRLMSGEIAV